MAMKVPPNLSIRGGVWYVQKKFDGRKRRESTGVTAGGEAELKRAIKQQVEILQRWQKDAEGGASLRPVTFGEWWLTYQSAYSAQNTHPEQDIYMVRFALAKWRAITMGHITKSMCSTLLQERLKVAEPGTVNRERGLLQAMFKEALLEGRVAKNPFLGIPRFVEVARDRVLLQEEEVKLRQVLSPQGNRFLTVMLGTGARIEELRMLTMKHVDRKAGLINLPCTKLKSGAPPKTRIVPLDDAGHVLAALDAQLAEKGRLWPANPQNYRDMLQTAAVAANIDHIWPHALRHTFATRYLQAGGDIYILSKILGHASVVQTSKTYAHLVATDIVSRSRGINLGFQLAK